MREKLLLWAFVVACLATFGAQLTRPASVIAASQASISGPSAKSDKNLPAEKAGPLRVPLFEKPAVIDGDLSDDVWKSAVVLKDFYQVQPGDNIAPSQLSEVLLGYDAKALYIAFRAYDEPGKVRATVAKRDDIFDDDYVGIYLDTFNDKRKAYGLFFNPHGIQQDGIYSEGGDDDFSVDIVMESKGKIVENGYTVEVVIPFKSLRYKAGGGTLWGFHAVRRIKRFNNELDSWMPMSRDITGKLTQAGHITGLENLSTERTLEIIPSFTLIERGNRVPAIPSDRFVNRPVSSDLGLTVKFGITSNIVLAFAANPDFAQVEADQPVVTANERFPIFFEEKRPFFLEGVEIFDTPLKVVHTRTIVDPDVAIKLTGKQGRSSFGILLASDNAPGNFSEEERNDPSLFPFIAKFIDKKAYTGVVRLKHDIGNESNIGFIATSYNFIEKHNETAGFDGRFRLNQQNFFSFQVLGTTSREFIFDPDLGEDVYGTGNGFGYYWNYNRTGKHLNASLNGSGRTSNYRAEVGFTRRVNTNQENISINYTTEPNPKARLISVSFLNNGYVNFDWQGRTQAFEQDPAISFNLSKETFIKVTEFIGYERVFEEEFGPKRTATREGAFIGNSSERHTSYKGTELAFSTTPSKKYSFDIKTWYGWGLFDFDLGSGPRFPRVSPAALIDQNAPFDPGPGNQWFAEMMVTYQPTDALRTSLNYTKSRLVRNDTRRVAFDSNIYTLRTTYQFTRFAFTRARIDYDSTESSLKGQFLVGWTPNPGTSFYAGYDDSLNYNGFNPFTGLRESGLRRNGRTFFIKLSYLIRKSF
ncbi:MAG TPA: DUF5916 domain-containing protein [Blastocatellia bacterium]|jgi:hypothetical protein|nr:DUF5916 domain-containing protein [Blastocatellia bacterium]